MTTTQPPAGTPSTSDRLPGAAAVGALPGPGDGPPPGPGSRWVGVPRKGDPRISFAALMTLYATTGTLFFSFNRSPVQLVVIVVAGCLFDMFLHAALRQRKLLFPMSAYISSISLGLILGYSHTLWLTLFPVFLTIGSKYVLTLRGKHGFNPSLLGVVGSLTLSGSLISAAPAYQWGGWWYTSTFMLAAAILLVVSKVDRVWLSFSFVFFYTLQVGLRAYILRFHIPWDVMFVGTLTTPPFFLFAFFMITDPATSPKSRKQQVGVALAITLVDLYFHTRWSVYTFFYAAFCVAGVRFLWGHAKVLREEGLRPRLREVARSTWPKSVALIAAIAVFGGVAWAEVIHPAVRIDDAGFTFATVPTSQTDMAVKLDPGTFRKVDPRVQHIAKWLISVGSGAYVDDVDGDGRMDVLLTSPLAQASQRVELLRNVTAPGAPLRFRRVAVPALDHFAGAPGKVGLASGALFFDADGDGDRDLLVLAAFGTPRLLRNDSTGPGHIAYTDVTKQSGTAGYFIGASANAIDYDRDGDLDVLLGEILPTHLSGYGKHAPRLNIFHLPKARYTGDRRGLKFMHDRWDNATDGGENVMLRNDGHGHFTRIRGRDLGMPETHYTISIGTADLNDDGWTDLYLASDFGRDDLYINEGGKRFRRVAGWLNESIGKDTYKGMDSTIADFDRNGHQDVYVSNVHHALQAEGSLLWMNEGTKHGTSEHDPSASAKRWPAPVLHDQATARGALNEDRFGWGGDSGDFDNDGWLDLTQANGMVGDKLDEMADGKRHDGCPDYWYVSHKLMQSDPSTFQYADKWGDLRGRCIFPDEAQRLYLNREGSTGHKVFVDVAKVVGLTHRGNGRGTAIADFNDDGWLDAVVAYQHEGPTVLQSSPTKLGKGRGWITLRLVGNGRSCNTDAAGSRVRVVRGGELPQLQEVQLVNGFSSQRDPRVHFGLGAKPPARVRVEVTWCGHGATKSYDVPRDSIHTLTQGGTAPPSATFEVQQYLNGAPQ